MRISTEYELTENDDGTFSGTVNAQVHGSMAGEFGHVGGAFDRIEREKLPRALAEMGRGLGELLGGHALADEDTIKAAHEAAVEAASVRSAARMPAPAPVPGGLTSDPDVGG